MRIQMQQILRKINNFYSHDAISTRNARRGLDTWGYGCFILNTTQSDTFSRHRGRAF